MNTMKRLGLFLTIAMLGFASSAFAQRTNTGSTSTEINVPQNIKLNVVAKSDLAIKKIQLNTPTVKQAKIHIVNNGPSTSPATKMLMEYIEAECPQGINKTQEYNVPALKKGEVYVVEINSVCIIGVNARFRVTVDPHKTVEDPNRVNNSMISDTIVK